MNDLEDAEHSPGFSADIEIAETEREVNSLELVRREAAGTIVSTLELFNVDEAPISLDPEELIDSRDVTSIVAQAQTLLESEDTGALTLNEIKATINTINKVKQKTIDECDQLYTLIFQMEHNERMRSYDQKTDKATLSTKDPRRFLVAFLARREQARLDKVQSEVKKLKQELEEKQKLRASLYSLSQKLDAKLTKLLFTETTSNLRLICKQYYEYYEKLSRDSSIYQSIVANAISSFIEPLVQESAKLNGVSADDRDRFVRVLRTRMDRVTTDGVEAINIRSELQTLLLETEWLSRGNSNQLERLILSITQKSIDELIRYVIGKRLAKDILPLRQAMIARAYYDGETTFDLSLLNQTEDEKLGGFLSFLRRELSPHSLQPDLPEFPLWNMFCQSEPAKEVLGEEISAQDEEIYHEILQRSLVDHRGDRIPLLVHYPSPEAIRNLILIATADYREYRTYHANCTLAKLSKRSDWLVLLSEAEAKYPEIAQVHEKLVVWRNTSCSSEPGIAEDLRSLTENTFRGERENPDLLRVAREGLTNKSILNILVEREVLDIAVAADIALAQDKLEFAIQQAEEKYKSGESTTWISDYWFKEGLRSTLFYLLDVSEDSKKIDEKDSAIVERYARFSREVISKADDPDVLYFLIAGPVINRLPDNSLNSNYLFDFLNAYKVIPELNQDSQLMTVYCEMFVDESTTLYFRKLIDNFKRFRNMVVPVIKAVQQGDINWESALNLPTNTPSVLDEELFDVWSTYKNEFPLDDPKTEQFFNQIRIAFKDNKAELTTILALVGKLQLSREAALVVPSRLAKLSYRDQIDICVRYPSLFLADDVGTDYYLRLDKAFGGNLAEIKRIVAVLAEGKISHTVAEKLPSLAKPLFLEEQNELRYFTYAHSEVLLKSEEDVRFINRIIGEFGRRAYFIISGYLNCLHEKVVSSDEKELILEFARNFKVITPTLIAAYKKAKERGAELIFFARLRNISAKMISSEQISDEDRALPYFQDLIHHVYPHNSGNWTTYESNMTCNDRSQDLAQFNIEPTYEIDLLAQSDVRLKEGEQVDDNLLVELQSPVYKIADQFRTEGGFDRGSFEKSLNSQLDDELKLLKSTPEYNDVDWSLLSTIEDKLSLLLLHYLFSVKEKSNQRKINELLLMMVFIKIENIADYIEGTRDRVSGAKNQDYALLCELNALFSVRIKEISRMLLEAALNNPQIATLMPYYFRTETERITSRRAKSRTDRMRIDTLGASEGFLREMQKLMKKRSGYEYSLEEIGKLIRRYEKLTNGLEADSSTSTDKLTREFFGRLKAQRTKTFRAIETITGKVLVDQREFLLGDFDPDKLEESGELTEAGGYDELGFASYAGQRAIDLYGDELKAIQAELNKFESTQGTGRRLLNCYFSKTKEAANARMVGGVCVSGDNPGKNKDHNIWDMPNYFQLILQDPESLQCQGLILLHHFFDNGKHILTASFNPSSTYLYTVDESALFLSLTGVLEQFAESNGIDVIAVSSNPTIRTNRTGGMFEKAMKERINHVAKKIHLDSDQIFSYSPTYSMSDVDVIWEKAE